MLLEYFSRRGWVMKVVIYAVRSGMKCRAYFSIAWGVDEKYWNDRADEMIRLRELVPLGAADVACSTLNERWKKEESTGSGLEPEKGRGANSAAAGRDWAELFREAVRTTWGAERTCDSGLEVERVRLGPTSRNGTELAAAARLAARHLAGRSLLRDEATQLLAGAAAPRLAAIDPLAALQYAALGGALQLTAAVAPKPAAPPQRGFRAWSSGCAPLDYSGLRRLRPAAPKIWPAGDAAAARTSCGARLAPLADRPALIARPA
ncbi:hypothetical protein [Cohnella cholangitidis]|uniref:hypothetical protein n=1 Tax=Cohnella cholangitidis TaxID=2598458 RepID=UPI001E540FE5|nr:hypothetical protein [Cohnella cholangitidis]